MPAREVRDRRSARAGQARVRTLGDKGRSPSRARVQARHHRIAVATKLLDLLGSGPGLLLEKARAVGDPLVVLPIACHLMWLQVTALPAVHSY
jgi:hypothetical protein